MRLTHAILAGLGAGLMVAPARADRIAENASCAGCHTDIATEWTRSLHRNAWRDPVFQKAYAVEPVAFCRGCHAPESNPAREPGRQAQTIGIGCVSCHVDAAGIHAARASPAAQHALVVDATLATPKLCARCHQFDFPAESHQRHPEPMQDTVAEHASSAEAATPCQGCHMPVVDGPDGRHRSHSFSVIEDPERLRQAVEIEAVRENENVRITLTAARVGHAFPTGDMFRRLEVRARLVDDTGTTIARARPVMLARTFEDRPRDPAAEELDLMRVEAEDTRVPPPGRGARVVMLALPRHEGRVVWSVVYQRMSTPMAAAFGVSQVLDEILLAEGSLPYAHLDAHGDMP